MFGIPISQEVGIALFMLAGIFAVAERGASFLERWGPRWRGLQRLDRERARAIVEEEERNAALAQLAQNSAAILAAVGSNGHSLHERVTHLQADMSEVKDRLASGTTWMREHEALHAREALAPGYSNAPRVPGQE